MKTELVLNNNTFNVYRHPVRTNEEFQAWNASDEYILNHISENEPSEDSSILIINDDFGAISLGLNKFKRTVWTDSVTSHQAILKNHEENLLDLSNLTIFPITENDETEYDIVLVRIPKTLSLLEYGLSKLNLKKGTKVIGFGMTKEVHNSTVKLFETYLGETKTSLAVKKARLIISTVEKEQAKVLAEAEFKLDGYDLKIVSYPNVFSANKLDIGTRLILNHIPEDLEDKRILDLGCGSGIIAAIAAQQNPSSTIVSIDDSYLAIKSAEETFKRNNLSNGEFIASNSYDQYEGELFDIILSNPPFHQAKLISDHISWRMLSHSYHQLNDGGSMIIVGNRHLNYHHKLKRIFKNIENLESSAKFVILQSNR